MKTRLCGFLFSIFCLVLLSAGRDLAAGDGKSQTKTVRAADGLKIVCDVCGKGDTALVFLHGWCGDREYWKNQAGAFADDYRIVAMDQAGHGQSGKDRKRWTVGSLADDVGAVVKGLGLKRVILVGHSMGGPVALMAAKRMPGTVVAVIGVDTLQNAEFKVPEEMKKKFIDGFDMDFKGTMRGGLAGLLGDNADPELVNWLVNRAAANDPKMAVGLMRDMMRLDNIAVLKEAGVPVRCINSAGGFKFFRPTEAAINKKYADYDVVRIDNVGHYPMLEKPGEFNEKLRQVLKEFAPKN